MRVDLPEPGTMIFTADAIYGRDPCGPPHNADREYVASPRRTADERRALKERHPGRDEPG
ncbi:hypothetical protein [Nonomuraea cavernae]|uniref:hypothetical protein n=1 Tax=Nonomuraea cavernae TaxID=2045107 RepID=UPI0034083D22